FMIPNPRNMRRLSARSLTCAVDYPRETGWAAPRTAILLRHLCERRRADQPSIAGTGEEWIVAVVIPPGDLPIIRARSWRHVIDAITAWKRRAQVAARADSPSTADLVG